jgi:hypothetical protein
MINPWLALQWMGVSLHVQAELDCHASNAPNSLSLRKPVRPLNVISPF